MSRCDWSEALFMLMQDTVVQASVNVTWAAEAFMLNALSAVVFSKTPGGVQKKTFCDTQEDETFNQHQG